MNINKVKFIVYFSPQSMKEGRNYKWAYAEPNVTALKTVAALVEKGQVRHTSRVV